MKKIPRTFAPSTADTPAAILCIAIRATESFKMSAAQAGVEMGRWAWSSDAWDFDHDGYSDLYIANGYISGPDPRDLSSFFWRQVVAKVAAEREPVVRITNRDGTPSTN